MILQRVTTVVISMTLVGLMTDGAWAAAGEVESAGIPKQFQGHWDMPGACKPDFESPLVTTITANKIRYYEVTCVLKSVITSNAQSVSGRFDCEEGGEKFAKELSLSIQHGELIDRNWPSESLALRRCK
jgi:hypothetical protein